MRRMNYVPKNNESPFILATKSIKQWTTAERRAGARQSLHQGSTDCSGDWFWETRDVGSDARCWGGIQSGRSVKRPTSALGRRLITSYAADLERYLRDRTADAPCLLTRSQSIRSEVTTGQSPARAIWGKRFRRYACILRRLLTTVNPYINHYPINCDKKRNAPSKTWSQQREEQNYTVFSLNLFNARSSYE